MVRKIIIEISGKEYSYPTQLPLPRIGEVIFVDNSEILCGRVYDIWHYPYSNKVKIQCTEYK